MDTDNGFRDFHYDSSDGLRLHARIYDADGDALPAICLPGLTRNARDFHEIAVFLSREAPKRRTVIAFDYRGRGQSAYAPDWKSYSPAIEAGDVVAGLAAMDIERGAFLGTSRGGLIIMILGAIRPSLLAGAVLNDIGPRVEGAGLAQIASYLKDAPRPKTFEEAVAVQRAAVGAGFPALSEADWQRMVRAINREGVEPPTPDYDPALLNTMAGIDLGKPLPELWPQFEALAGIPLLAIRGGNSTLLSAGTLAEMTQRHPDLETITVEGQGHAPLLETGDLPRRIAAFLEKVDGRG